MAANEEYAKSIYLQLKSMASLYDIDFHLYFKNSGGFGELCMDWNEEDGYLLYGDERGEMVSLFTTKDFNIFKYEVFLHLAFRMGLEYELKHRDLTYIRKSEDDLYGDTRKRAFEETIRLLRAIDDDWAKSAATHYTEYLNMWRTKKNVRYDFDTATFTVDKF
ncbi:Imm63 family immunity protein [Paenilisteria rocourtiae]|uniref:Immunity protein 63 of polymorphic toxin system n=1 Tax=Listeria rocourtiae TaxID=647910 RepID=A0A4R6ZJC8_9LIST|nr:Imm63 family immunity protein [Listeria rocourtiae]EUJ47309.1 hypothetical protein PROCOU_09421 [Listeria rocourtiae FSL F6-920]MBC1605135.1 hypothetical protein [Listeria rocourtiae]TDR52134.1 immunity protein 63 of polymorphic toxin system [Listeria rocourtiae]